MRLWALHPGGRSIFDALGEALGLDDDVLSYAREVLRRFGNMPSATIMFVLKVCSRQNRHPGWYAEWLLARDLPRKA
jgi:predicted naringenin-chalcone synthase